MLSHSWVRIKSRFERLTWDDLVFLDALGGAWLMLKPPREDDRRSQGTVGRDTEDTAQFPDTGDSR
jgi:hypothetical protein